MRVLITGAAGLLGSAVAREMAPVAEIIPLVRGDLDVADDGAVARVMEARRPDAVINCAAYNDVDRAEDEPVEALTVNALAVNALARASAACGAAFVHYSSDFVFDGESTAPYTEADRPNPRSTYGASKLLGDLFALETPRAYVLRVESLFGPASPGGRRGSLATIVDRIRQGAEVPVFVDRVVSPSYTPDIARATRTLLEIAAPPGLYNCVNSGHATWAEVAESAAQSLGMPFRMRPLRLAEASLRARRPAFCALSNAKIVAAGCAMPHWREALRRFLVEA